MTAWRLTHERFAEQALSGNGGLFAPGRWHSRGRRIVYASDSLALATLELFVNLPIKQQLAHYVKSRIEIPESLIEVLKKPVLQTFLEAPEQFDSRSYGDAWLADKRSCVLQVPSRVVPQEWNYLLNPLHPSFNEITAMTDAYEVDGRLLL
ncbi:RES family NAD+ phosphorylase [soil metagenome]